MTLHQRTTDRVNRELGHDPEALVEWAHSLGEKVVATTSFGPFSAVLLHMIAKRHPQTPVLWMDSGYATAQTYRYLETVRERLGLNLHIYHPRRSRAHREAVEGPVPALDDPRHAAFTREVKLEPFERAMREMSPVVWITGVRAEETAHRAQMEPVTLNPEGIIKVAPLLGWSSRRMHEYLKQHDLPNNLDYYDPTKGEEHRECGLHLAY